MAWRCGRRERECDSCDAERECTRAAMGRRSRRREHNAGGDGAAESDEASNMPQTASGLTLRREDASQHRPNRCWRRLRQRRPGCSGAGTDRLRPRTVSMAGTSRAASALAKNVHCRAIRADILLPEGGAAFEAWLAGMQCTGSYEPSPAPGQWTASCQPSDDPWPMTQFEQAAVPVKAFYNAARNYFTGVVTPNIGVDLPPFYCGRIDSARCWRSGSGCRRHRRQSVD